MFTANAIAEKELKLLVEKHTAQLFGCDNNTISTEMKENAIMKHVLVEIFPSTRCFEQY